MKRRGLLTAIILGVFVLTGFAQAQDVSVFTRKQPKIERRYGIQLTGNFGLYAMQDVNDYRATGPDHVLVGNTDGEATQGIAWGIAAVYRSHQNFRWTIGYSVMGQDKTSASWINSADGQNGFNEQTVNGSELYVLGSYMIRFSEVLNLHLGLGPSIVNGSMDRNSTAATSIYNAKGRGVGFRAQAGVEFLMTNKLSLNVLGGYRYANIGELRYDDRNQDEQILYYNAGSNKTLALDFSGIFVEFGIRMYFDPSTGWFKM